MKIPPIRLQEIVFLAVFISVMASGTQMLSIDSDLGRHLTLGNYILDNHVVPTRDLFSHTLTGESRPPYEWLSQVLFAISHRLLGLDGVILLTSLIISASISVIFYQSVHRSGSPLVAFAVALLTATATSIHWLPRPHIVTFLLLVVWINQLEQVQKNRVVSIYIFPLLMFLWANLHGGFIFGFLALAAYSAGWLWEKWRKQTTDEIGKKYLLIGLTSSGASIISPDLWHNWEAVLNNRSAFILSRTAETMPPDLSNPSVTPFVILLALAMAFSLANRRSVLASHIFLLGGLGTMSLLMTRNIPLFAIACAPILTGWISTVADKIAVWKRLDERFAGLVEPSSPYIITILTSAIAIGIFLFFLAQDKQGYHFNSHVFPTRAADWLEKKTPNGNMFNEFNWGGYLLYRTWPRGLVFVDSQSDFYGEPLMRDYETILLAKNNWRDLLENYEVDWVIVSPQSPLAIALANDTTWMTNYQDTVAIILQRK